MFKLSPISASAKLQPFEEPEPEVPPVELVIELVKVELQELRLYVVVCIENAPFGVADGDMHPKQDLAHFLLVIHDNSLVERHRPVLFKGGYVLEPSVVVFAFPSVACFILGVSVETLKSSMTSIFMCPTTLGAVFLVFKRFGAACSFVFKLESCKVFPNLSSLASHNMSSSNCRA